MGPSTTLPTPSGFPCSVPLSSATTEPYSFSLPHQLTQALSFYQSQGFVVVRQALSPFECDQIRSAWSSEIKSYKGKLYRQTTAKLEVNSFNAQGFVMNPVLNPHSLSPRRFPAICSLFDTCIADNSVTAAFLEGLYNCRAKLVQSMYFEGNSATWEHQDSYYLDSSTIGQMCAGWLALEDISPMAGRFFVVPGSHSSDYSSSRPGNNYGTNHQNYKASIAEVMASSHLQPLAPALSKGDILFWNSLTIHGSLDTQDSTSRSSLTFHTIPSNQDLLSLRSFVRKTPSDASRRILVYRPKDASKLSARFFTVVESSFPTLFHYLKSMCIRLLSIRTR